MNLIDRLHAFATDRLGISPKVADPFFAGLLGLVVASLIQWAATGVLAFDLVQLKILGVVFVLGVLGYAAPIALSPMPSGKTVRLNMKQARTDARAPRHSGEPKIRRH